MNEPSQHKDEAPDYDARNAGQAPAETEPPLALEAEELGAALGLDDETVRLFVSTGC